MTTPDRSTSVSPGSESLTEVQQDVLDAYAQLAESLGDLARLLGELAASPSVEMLDALRGLERKTGLVHTLLKASVYSIVLEHQIQGGDTQQQQDVN